MSFRHIAGLDDSGMRDKRLSLAIGMFDGVHLGHRKVLKSALDAASVHGSEAGALVFWPHPSRIFRPEEPTLMISTPEMKREAIAELGLSFVIEEPFTRSFAAVEAREFVAYLKERLPNLVSLHVGENWRFGRGRLGDSELLSEIAPLEGVEAQVVHSVEMGEERVSSTRIRIALEMGRIEEANRMLGRSYSIKGQVQQGRRLGRSIGIPTLNIPFAPELKPRFGVYIGTVTGEQGETPVPAIFNFGVRPTVDDRVAPLVEAHALGGECPFDYGDTVRIEFKSYLRDEKRFDGVAALRAQIESDIEKAKDLLES